METEELIKLVDGIYKNILDKFNPGARQMINAGKAYLKALHGAAAASRMYVDAISKLAKQAQQGTWGGSSDIGGALMKIVEVYKEIQDQQMNILKAFYVDLLVPLETNLEKDTKVVQSEQKRFLQQHKQRSETYSKAAAMMKKQRKKSRGSSKSGLAMDKELKNMQVLEEEKTKLDTFCELSLKNAMTQERRRYGFVLERQCSLAKHYLSYHTQGVQVYQQNIDKWSEVAKTREYLPDSVENIFSNRLRQISVWQDDDLYSNPRSPNFEEDRMSINSQLRKTKSMDASCLDIRSIGDVGSPVTTLSRAKSEFNLNNSSNQMMQPDSHTLTRHGKKLGVVPPPPAWDTLLARALYAYLSSGENQLSFHEGDLIALIGERNKGWQFGENLRTQCSGWFPLAYTEVLDDPTLSTSSFRSDSGGGSHNLATGTPPPSAGSGGGTPSGNSTLEQPARMFGDTLHLQRSSNNAKQIRRAIGFNNIPPPALPAPVPTPSLPNYQKNGSSNTTTMSQSQSTNNFGKTNPGMDKMKNSNSFNFSTHPQVGGRSNERPTGGGSVQEQRASTKINSERSGGNGGDSNVVPVVGNVSLHSSNDSGFSNDPPPQPEIDYSDDESMIGQQAKGNNSRTNTRPKSKEQRSSDKNNNSNRIKQSSSHGNLVDSYHMSNDPEILSRERKLVKRTKSFWKFGKNSSDSEILEGMALWRHRDLVDVEDESNGEQSGRRRIVPRKNRDHSSDSDKTISKVEVELKHRASFHETKKPIKAVLPRRNSSAVQHQQKVVASPRRGDSPKKIDDQFYDDDGDGLMLKTVNRKNILQQYSNDSSGSDSDSESDLTSDPYDCIVVDDQKMKKKNDSHFPNVAELGKKLEKLSKNNKFSPKKDGSLSPRKEEQKNNFNRRSRSSYETIESEQQKYYDSATDELSEVENKPQFLPRTKLNNNSKNEEYDLMDYGETLQKRMKNPGEFPEKMPRNGGNMYGPWYDLWGLDSSVKIKNK